MLTLEGFAPQLGYNFLTNRSAQKIWPLQRGSGTR